jgi:hypothetical protein
VTRVELLYFEGCPHAAGARALLRACIDRLGLAIEVEEPRGDFPSPTILIDGRDIMGQPSYAGRCCRLDVPTDSRLMEALRR